MATDEGCEIRHVRIDRNLSTYSLIQTLFAPTGSEYHAVEWGALPEILDVDYQDFRNIRATVGRWRTR